MMGSGRMSTLMRAEVLDKHNPLAQQLYNALHDNSNVGYPLQAPAFFLHSTNDAVVPIINSLNLQAAMPDNATVTFDYDAYGSHAEAALPFMQYVYQDL
jgi:pimeloyl-ACP methyl ester carboxylesterase